MSENSTAKKSGGKLGKKMGLAAIVAGLVAASVWTIQNPTDGIQQQSGSSLEEPVTPGGPATVRRLSEAQYKRSIQHIFGDNITVPGRFDPPVREDFLLAIGNSSATVTASGLEQHMARAEDIAKQVLSVEHRDNYLKCQPKAADQFDQACAEQFLSDYGRLLFRRLPSDEEMATALKVTREATETFSDFYRGLEYGLMSQLISPSFIYRAEVVEPNPEGISARLDAYSVASRISFLLWDAPPDTELLDVAASGAIFDDAVLQKQVDRMIASPRFEEGVRAFFWDMFGYDQFVGLGKDTELFPRFSAQLKADAEEQSMRTIIDLLVTQNGDYRDLFTTQTTFINRNLGALFRVPVSAPGEDGWMKYTFNQKDNRAGILTMPAFLMLDPSHEGQSSPTIRGKTVRELVLCHEVPPPPGDVNFDIVQNSDSPLRTARERLALHNEDAVCAGCHAVTDPIGLGFENFDAIGQFRTHEKGALIDPTGTVDGIAFQDAVGLQKAIIDSGAATSCITRRTYEYVVGREVESGEFKLMNYLNNAFAQGGYKFTELMRVVATSKALQTVASDENTHNNIVSH